MEANRELVKLDTASKLIPNVELFISMYVRKEALISSQIEGTQCTLDDVLDQSWTILLIWMLLMSSIMWMHAFMLCKE